MHLESSLSVMGDQAINTIKHASVHIDVTKGILKIAEKGLMGDKKVEKGVKGSWCGVQAAEKHELMAEFLFPASGQELQPCGEPAAGVGTVGSSLHLDSVH
ncbi:hypothetical protein C343_02550 [Cryptococcus neoformans C23]|nr:hypothetical protein C343_02550 [Cryptococcus neoformans var. grubii C23]